MPVKTILAVQGASNEIIQSLLLKRAQAWSALGAQVVGVVEMSGVGEKDRLLRDIETGREFAITQDLGPGSLACRLTGEGVAEACEMLQRRIERGCDLVVLSKFGKLEAERSGLTAAFAAAVAAGVPILTAVSPTFAEQWLRFAGPLAAYAPPASLALDAWWRTVQPARMPPSDISLPREDRDLRSGPASLSAQ